MEPREGWKAMTGGEGAARAAAAARSAFEKQAMNRVLTLTGAKDTYMAMRRRLFEIGADATDPSFEYLLETHPSFPVRFRAAKLYHLDEVTLAAIAKAPAKTNIHRAYREFSDETGDDWRTKAIVFNWPHVCAFAVAHNNPRVVDGAPTFAVHYTVRDDPATYVIEPLAAFIAATGWRYTP